MASNRLNHALVVPTMRSTSALVMVVMMVMVMAVFITLGGCQRQGPKTTPWYKITDPRMEIIGVELAEQTPEGARFEVIARLINPNDVALPLVRYHLTFDLDNGGPVTFRDNANRTLPALGEQRLTMPLAIPSAATKGADLIGEGYKVSGWLTYEPPGEIRRLLTESGVPLPGTSFRGDGQLAASQTN